MADKHPIALVARKLAISRAFWVIVAVVTFALHVAWARNTHGGANLARCGALWAVYGAALLARPVIRQGYTAWFVASQKVGGAGLIPSAAEIEEDRQIGLDAGSIQIIAPVLIVGGTILWGYGDLLGDWLFACHCR